jgi:hypothetical protein
MSAARMSPSTIQASMTMATITLRAKSVVLESLYAENVSGSGWQTIISRGRSVGALGSTTPRLPKSFCAAFSSKVLVRGWRSSLAGVACGLSTVTCLMYDW